MAAKKVEEVKRYRKEGEEGGYAQVFFDPEHRCNAHLNALGEKVLHGVPEGFTFDDQGRLHPVKTD